MKKPSVSLIALSLSVLAVLVAFATLLTLEEGLREALAAGRPCVLPLVFAIWGAILGAGVASYVHPVPKMAWGAICVSTLVVLVFLMLLHVF